MCPRACTVLVGLASWLSEPTLADWLLSVWVALKLASADFASKNVVAVAFVVIVRVVMPETS